MLITEFLCVLNEFLVSHGGISCQMENESSAIMQLIEFN